MLKLLSSIHIYLFKRATLFHVSRVLVGQVREPHDDAPNHADKDHGAEPASDVRVMRRLLYRRDHHR